MSIEQAIDRLKEAKLKGGSVAVLTGAGISAESGIPTFRGAGGLWKTCRPEELATAEAFEAQPEVVWEWYEWRRGIIRKAGPNPGHLAIAQMESLFSNFFLITQNVDNLHERAGSRTLVHLHGTISHNRCYHGCPALIEAKEPQAMIPKCSCGALMRPAVVWFGEMLPEEALEHAAIVSQEASVFLSVGTSGIVHPAASLPLLAKSNGAFLIEVNPDPTPLTSSSDLVLQGPSGVILPSLMAGLTSRTP